MVGLLAAVLCTGIVFAAAQAGEILSFGIEDNRIVLYIPDPGDGCEIQCQVGTSQAEKIESHPISDEAVPIETIILLDNSLSVVEKYRPVIRSIMSELAANRMNGELFTVAIFSDQIQYLVQKSNDYAQVKQAIDQIEYHDQETYLTDVLYGMLSEINAENSTTLKRIVIISDGVDNKSIGYTKEELYGALEKTPYPIFALGCTYKDNNEQLKNMFALSRMTGGEAWLLDEVDDPMTVVGQIASLNHAVKVVVTPKKTECDGSRKGVNLIVKSGEESVSDSVEMNMPFDTVEETTIPPATAPTTTVAEIETMESEPELEEAGASKGIMHYLIIGGGILLAALTAGGILYLRQRREEKNRFVSAEPIGDSDMPGGSANIPRHTTQICGVEDSSKRSTMFVWGEEAAHVMILEDINNPIKRFEVSLEDSILVGYNNDCQISLNYEETVSGRHCRIYRDNNKIYVENLSQTNGTYVDGKRVVGVAEIYAGCVLKMGNLMMRIEIR